VVRKMQMQIVEANKVMSLVAGSQGRRVAGPRPRGAGKGVANARTGPKEVENRASREWRMRRRGLLL
jgi:hypothetical protein